MTVVLLVLVVVLAVALAALAASHFGPRARRLPRRPPTAGSARVLFPFMTSSLAPRALEVALRLARAEDATLVPTFLAQVPMHLPLDAPLPRQSAIAIPLQEAIEQRAASYDVPVDARIERGRTYRHALRQTIANERFERIVIAASAHGHPGFNPDDVAWLLDHAPGEIIVLRPDEGERIGPPPRATARRSRRGGPRRGPRRTRRAGGVPASR